VFRGVELTLDDRLRREVINQLICLFELAVAGFEAQHDIVFWDYFKEEWEALLVMAQDGLINLDQQGLKVLPAGRLLIRNICMVFDRYLKIQADDKVRYSKVI